MCRYYYLPYCEPDNVKESVENLGEILAGDVIETSSYEVCEWDEIDNHLTHPTQADSAGAGVLLSCVWPSVCASINRLR